MDRSLQRIVFSILFLASLVVLRPVSVDAATYTWDGGGVDNNWSTCANWSSDICPLSTDSVIFSNTSTKNVDIDTNITVVGFTINSGYTGAIAPTGVQTITINGTFTQATGTFTASQATTTFASTFTYTGGTFNHNSGIALFGLNNTASTITPGSIPFNNVVFDYPAASAAASILSIASDMTIGGSLIVKNTNSSSGSLTIRSSASAIARTITVAGSITLPSTASTASLYFGSTDSSYQTNYVFQGGLSIEDSNAQLNTDITFASASTQAISRTGGSIGSNSDWFDTGSGNLSLTSNFSGSQILNPNDDNDFAFEPTVYTFTSNSAKVVTGTSFTPSGASAYIFTALNLSDPGTFNMTSSTTIMSFTQSAGTFNAIPSATTTFSGNFTYTSGTFNHNAGTVQFNNQGGAGITVTSNAAQFNNVVFDMPGNISSASYHTSLGSGMTILGNLILQNTNTNTGFYTLRSTGTATRTVTVAGDLLFPSTGSSATVFAGNSSVGFPVSVELQGNFDMRDSSVQMYFDIVFASSSNQTLNKTSGTIASLSNWYDTSPGDFILSANFSGAQTLNPDSATDFNFVANAYTFTSGSVSLSSGDIFTPAGPASYVYTNKVIMPTGTFNVSDNSVFNGGIELSGGTLNLSSGTTTIRAIQSYEGFVITSGTFNHNNGTVVFDPTSNGMTITTGGNSLYNVIFDYTTSSSNVAAVSIGSDVNILGNMIVRNNQPSTGTLRIRSSLSGTARAISVAGDFTLASTSPSTASISVGDSSGNTYVLNFTVYGNIGIFDSSSIYTDFVLAGSGDQTFSSTAGVVSSPSDWTINKPSGSFQLLSTMSILGTINIATGTLRTLGSNLTTAVGGLTVGAAGNLQIYGNESVSTTTFATSSTMTYEGTVGPYTLKNFSYKNLTIQGSGATFSTPAALTIGGNLSIVAGTLDVTGANHGLTVFGNWSNTGSFNARAGTTTLNGVNQSITGTTTFYRLVKQVTSPDTLTFGANQTQTIQNTWTMTGTDGNLLSLRSTNTGTRWNINPQGTRNLAYIDVKDSNNVDATVIGAVTGIVNSGNNLNWGFDSTAPSATGISVTTATSSADVVWNTDEAATSTLVYGLTSAYGSTSVSIGTTSHSVAIAGLTSGTVYHYAIVSSDILGNTATTTDATFTTADDTAPVASSIVVTPSATTTLFSWYTNEAATSTVQYSTDSSFASSSTSVGTTSHTVTLSDLASGILYNYRIVSRDATGNYATTTAGSFVTIDAIAPIISNINSTGDQTTRTITWNTNETTGSFVDYGLTSSYGIASTSNGTVSHSVTLTGLTASTVYHYRITATDMMANSSVTADFTFTTSANPDVPAVAQSQSSNLGGWSGPIFGDMLVAIPAQLKPHVPPAQNKFIFKKDLAMGMKNIDVKELQKFLNRNGFMIAQSGPGSIDKETTLFGPATKAAVLKFQKYKKIKGANGRFGPATRSTVNSIN